MMTKSEKLELATIVANAVVEAMKASAVNPTSANTSRNTKKGRGSNEAKKSKAPKYSVDLKDYEPKKNGGFYNWASYKSNRTKFCYAYATGGKTQGCFENGERYCTFDQIEDKYAEAKKIFEKKYKYTKKEDR